jgi:DNA mismatch endonuclease, patch repair protein
MTDRISPAARSSNMARIRSTDTGPERRVRCALHAAGFRFRLHRRDLPGTPDLVLPRWKVVVFVHGCYWHRHAGCRNASTPKSQVEFWQAKFDANVDRDTRVQERLFHAGWTVIVIWECQTANPEAIVAAVRDQMPSAVPAPVQQSSRTISANPTAES